ncbi:MAG: DUF2071 domain-containing protein [Acidobacteria bacterium]|nr:DUF2071 domain-containing protein [Acidobacteriota bacterium]
MLYTPSLRTKNIDAPLWGMTPLPKIQTSVFTKELRHRSVISYQVPSERIRDLVPVEFDLAGTTLLTIESFLDCGRTNFEQTNYRFHVSLNGKPCSWLLGTSLGSLSGVTARHLYPLPWHLSAMEFQVALDPSSDKYKRYRLSSQSQWANADWEILDTGTSLLGEKNIEVTDYFVRRDGEIGSYQTIYKSVGATQGKLKTGRCDLLGSLGILSSDELASPACVALQRAGSCEIKPAACSANVRLAA